MPREERDEQAFTGLEAGIIFIAFVVVASVFAYVVLGTGMAASQKNQEVLYSALDKAGSALRPGDVVIAKLETGRLNFIEFDLETAAGPTAIDTRSMTFTIATTEALSTFPPGNSTVKFTWRYRRDIDDILEEGEIVTVRLKDLKNTGIKRGDTFTVGVAAAGGATASLTRTIPAGAGGTDYIELF